MDSILRNVLGFFAGIIAGWLVNGGIIAMTGSVFPPPSGVDPTDIESIKANLHLYDAKHFLFPFIAHALGSLVGALVVVKIAASHKMKFAIAIGAFFLVGGVLMAYMLQGPIWFLILDLLIAYLPMAWIGAKLARV